MGESEREYGSWGRRWITDRG
ncbi:uncharacterized protein G2W53_031497 [Senna tora]|uniref:Uncharacterized protein n=1 Tax=Senna tora TaxID=362788 RepID=A0A834T8W7_9FABA|nr:uncharacterized protein G2W53_031497 [Senna tora]